MAKKVHTLDPTQPNDWLEIAGAFGAAAAWRAAIIRLTAREARATDRRTKQHLRLLLANAHTQLALTNEEQDHA